MPSRRLYSTSTHTSSHTRRRTPGMNQVNQVNHSEEQIERVCGTCNHSQICFRQDVCGNCGIFPTSRRQNNSNNDINNTTSSNTSSTLSERRGLILPYSTSTSTSTSNNNNQSKWCQSRTMVKPFT